MRRIALLVVVAALVPASAMAQCCLSVPSLDSLRVRAGYFDLGELGGSFGAGADVRFNALGRNWLAGVEAADSGDVLGGSLNVVMDMPLVAANLYLGGGGGLYRIDRHGGSDESFGVQAVAGISSGVGGLGDWYLEARYVAMTDFSYSDVGAGDIDGLRLCLGYAYKF